MKSSSYSSTFVTSSPDPRTFRMSCARHCSSGDASLLVRYLPEFSVATPTFLPRFETRWWSGSISLQTCPQPALPRMVLHLVHNRQLGHCQWWSCAIWHTQGWFSWRFSNSHREVFWRCETCRWTEQTSGLRDSVQRIQCRRRGIGQTTIQPSHLWP